MFELDKIVSLWLFRITTSLHIEWLAKFFATYSLWILLIIFLYLLFKTEGERKKIYSVGLLLLLLIIGRGILVEIIRFFYYNPRPFKALDITPLVNGSNSSSFPSGHATSMFLIALAFLFFENKRANIISFTLAVLGSVARVMVGVHWVSDIVVGFVLAVLVFIFVYHFLLPKKLAYKNEVAEQMKPE